MNIRKLLCKMIVYSFDSIILFCCYDFFLIFFFREISHDRFWHISQLINVFRFSSLSDLVMLWSLIVCSFLSILLLCLFCMITFNITLEMILIMFWINLGLFDGWNRTEILLGYWLWSQSLGFLYYTVLYCFDKCSGYFYLQICIYSHCGEIINIFCHHWWQSTPWWQCLKDAIYTAGVPWSLLLSVASTPDMV